MLEKVSMQKGIYWEAPVPVPKVFGVGHHHWISFFFHKWLVLLFLVGANWGITCSPLGRYTELGSSNISQPILVILFRRVVFLNHHTCASINNWYSPFFWLYLCFLFLNNYREDGFIICACIKSILPLTDKITRSNLLFGSRLQPFL